MYKSIALITATLSLASCASVGSDCIDPKPFTFSSDEIAEAYAEIPDFRQYRKNDEKAEDALAIARKALNDFTMTPEGETRFLRRSLGLRKVLADADGARADITRMKALGTLYEGEADFHLAQIARLSTSADAGIDRDAQPLVRFPPIMSKAAISGDKSGYCTLEFDVSKIGIPENIRLGFCTDNIFRESSIVSVAKWKYNPAIRNGVSVQRKDVETTIRYVIQDSCGNTLPL